MRHPFARYPGTHSFAESMSVSLIFILCFFIVLAFALLLKMTGLNWRRWLGAESASSVCSGVKAVVHSFLPYIG